MSENINIEDKGTSEMTGTQTQPGGFRNGTTWDSVYKLAQLLVYPTLIALLYLLTMINGLDKRFVAIETRINSEVPLSSLVGTLAVIQERQSVNTRSLDALADELDAHRDKSTYDSNRDGRPRKR